MFNPLETKGARDFADALLMTLDGIRIELKRANDMKEYEIEQKKREQALPSMFGEQP